jgi:hypothetical protein
VTCGRARASGFIICGCKWPASFRVIWRVLEANLDHTTHISSAIQDALDGDARSSAARGLMTALI